MKIIGWKMKIYLHTYIHKHHTHTYFLTFLGVLTVKRPDFSEGVT